MLINAWFLLVVLADEFQCTGGGVSCIPVTWRCDLESDCKDGSDELNCMNNTCADYQFSCGPPTYRCIYSSWVCDGDPDCKGGNDELNCNQTITTLPKSVNPFLPTVSDFKWLFRCLVILKFGRFRTEPFVTIGCLRVRTKNVYRIGGSVIWRTIVEITATKLVVVLNRLLPLDHPFLFRHNFLARTTSFDVCRVIVYPWLGFVIIRKIAKRARTSYIVRWPRIATNKNLSVAWMEVAFL